MREKSHQLHDFKPIAWSLKSSGHDDFEGKCGNQTTLFVETQSIALDMLYRFAMLETNDTCLAAIASIAAGYTGWWWKSWVNPFTESVVV